MSSLGIFLALAVLYAFFRSPILGLVLLFLVVITGGF